MSDTFNMYGDFRGATINIKNHIGQISTGTTDEKNRLEALVDELLVQLHQAPPTAHTQVAEVIKQIERLIKNASIPAPNKEFMEISSKGMMEAVQALGMVIPKAVEIARQIARLVIDFGV